LEPAQIYEWKKRRTFFEDDDVKVSLEEINDALYVHCIFHNCTLHSVKWIKDIWQNLKERCYFAGYDAIYSYTKDLRVVKLFPDWQLVSEVVDDNGEKWQVVKWELN